jgi:hypothetical protein
MCYRYPDDYDVCDDTDDFLKSMEVRVCFSFINLAATDEVLHRQIEVFLEWTRIDLRDVLWA